MNNLSSYCGLVDTKIRASDKDLPVSLTDSNIVVKSGEILGTSLVKKVFSDPKCILYVGGTLI